MYYAVYNAQISGKNFAAMLTFNESTNLFAVTNDIPGIWSLNIYKTKKQAIAVRDNFNKSYKENGSFYWD